MVEQPTVFILGAGASCPYGYPSGTELRTKIIGDFPDYIEKYYKARSSTYPAMSPDGWRQEANEFAAKFARATIESIDLFLAVNPEYMSIGKSAIILCLLHAEQNSAFREHSPKKHQDWYTHIFGELIAGMGKKDDYARFGENNISFITFNYDRSLEYFLYDSLVHLFNGIAPDKIKEQLDAVRIIHVFGKIASLAWQTGPSRLRYKHNPNAIDLGESASNLSIIHEENDNPELKEAKELISKAERIFFLGFGYAEENLKVLGIPGVFKKGQGIYGTALHATVEKIKKIRLSLKSEGQHLDNIRIQSVDCLQLLREEF